MADPRFKPTGKGFRQQPVERAHALVRQPRIGLAAVVAARVQRAAQRADRALVGRAHRHVRGFEMVFADHALQRLATLALQLVGARQVIPPTRRPGNERRGQHRSAQCNEGRHGLRHAAEQAQQRGHRQHRRNKHRADPDRVDVVQVRAAKLHMRRRQAQRLVDHQVGHHRADPGNRHQRVQTQHMFQRLEDAHFHQQHRNEHIEDHPHHPARMAVGQPRKEVGPGQRAGIGVGDVDLHLRHHHEQGDCAQHPGRVGKHIAEADQVHAGRLHRLFHRHLLLDGEKGQQRAAQHLGRAHAYPAWPGQQQRGPPAAPVGRGLLRQEAQEVDLLADLRHQRNRDRRRGAEQQQVEARAIFLATREGQQVRQRFRLLGQHEHIRQHQQHDPHRLGPQLQPADQRHAMGHQRNDDQRAQHIAPRNRQVEVQLDCLRHDGRFQRKEDEGEGRVDQRSDGRADIAEAGAAREQVHVHAIARRVIADRQASQEDQQRHAQDGPERVGETVGQRNGAADRFERQEGHRAQRCISDAEFRPAPKGQRRIAQRIVLQRFVGDPGVVIASYLDDALGGGAVHGFSGLGCAPYWGNLC